MILGFLRYGIHIRDSIFFNPARYFQEVCDIYWTDRMKKEKDSGNDFSLISGLQLWSYKENDIANTPYEPRAHKVVDFTTVSTNLENFNAVLRTQMYIMNSHQPLGESSRNVFVYTTTPVEEAYEILNECKSNIVGGFGVRLGDVGSAFYISFSINRRCGYKSELCNYLTDLGLENVVFRGRLR